ncbi:MAG: T9SS type A sorting domain-containing protein, partial [Chitinophagaceae bacterium]|nr:T9SS type A sorting domain-containing protein [Chitinophagaceae bacterium]
RNEKVSIIVRDMLGKKVYQASGSGNNQYTFGSQFKSGIYTVQVMQGKVTQTIKVVKGN